MWLSPVDQDDIKKMWFSSNELSQHTVSKLETCSLVKVVKLDEHGKFGIMK